MKKTLLVIIATAILSVCSICYGAAPAPCTAAGLIPPPAINIPYGGKIIAEVNLSDNDILGIIKQVVTAAADTSDDMVVQAKQSNSEPSVPVALISSLQLQKLAEVISGVKNVRLVVAKYGNNVNPSSLINDFEKGLAKTGTYSKIASGLDIVPGVVGLYAAADNSGYVSLMYDSHERMLYAVRAVGSLDIPKLTEWAVRAVGSLKLQGGELGNLLGVPVPSTQNDGAQVPNQ
jgi:hypothetical protein